MKKILICFKLELLEMKLYIKLGQNPRSFRCLGEILSKKGDKKLRDSSNNEIKINSLSKVSGENILKHFYSD